jgi:hypothetical protein
MKKMIMNFLFNVFLIGSFSFSVTNELLLIVNYNDDNNQMDNDINILHNQTNLCQHTMTLSEILQLLKQQPRTIIKK